MVSKIAINLKLIVAAEDGDLSLIKSLLAQGADVNYQDEYGYCAVLRTVHDDYPECLQLLIDHQANLDLKNGDGYFALWWSVFFRHYKCLETIAMGGADLDIQDNSGQTALHLACDMGYLEGVKFLAEHGASFSIADSEGNFPVDVARINNRQEIVDYINSYHDQLALNEAIDYGDEMISEGMSF